MVELRVLTPDDWAMWRELRIAALTDAPGAFTTRLVDVPDDEAYWRARLDLPGAHNLLALLDGRPAGIARGTPAAEDGVAELHSMWVSPIARGHGVADELIGEVERWARRSGAGLLRLYVMRGNERAIALYRRNGFADGLRDHATPDGQIALAKKL